jgi:hypothetical protein
MERTPRVRRVGASDARREWRSGYEGKQFQLRCRRGRVSGSPSSSSTRRLRSEIRSYDPRRGPKNIKMVTEIADGGGSRSTTRRNDRPEVYAESLTELKPCSNQRTPVTVSINDDREMALQPVSTCLSFNIGAMGREGKELPPEPGEAASASSARPKRSSASSSKASAPKRPPPCPTDSADEILSQRSPARSKDRAQAWKSMPVHDMLVGRPRPHDARSTRRGAPSRAAHTHRRRRAAAPRRPEDCQTATPL